RTAHHAGTATVVSRRHGERHVTKANAWRGAHADIGRTTDRRRLGVSHRHGEGANVGVAVRVGRRVGHRCHPRREGESAGRTAHHVGAATVVVRRHCEGHVAGANAGRGAYVQVGRTSYGRRCVVFHRHGEVARGRVARGVDGGVSDGRGTHRE